MKRHYIVHATILKDGNEFLCPVGAVCTQEDLRHELSRRNVNRYKIMSVDSEPVAGWNDSDWIQV